MTPSSMVRHIGGKFTGRGNQDLHVVIVEASLSRDPIRDPSRGTVGNPRDLPAAVDDTGKYSVLCKTALLRLYCVR